jgi:hypothetical protein
MHIHMCKYIYTSIWILLVLICIYIHVYQYVYTPFLCIFTSLKQVNGGTEEVDEDVEDVEEKEIDFSSSLNANAMEFVPKESIHSAAINADTVKASSPPRKKAPFIDKYNKIFILKGQEAVSRLRNLSMSDRLIRQLQKEFKLVLDIGRFHSFVVMYLAGLLEPLLQVQQLIQTFEEIIRDEVG